MKSKVGLPIWFFCVIFVLFLSTCGEFLTYIGLNLSTADYYLMLTLGYIIGIIDGYITFRSMNIYRSFFNSVGINNIHVIKNTELANGREILISLPMGKCLSDFNKYKEALEQFLNFKIEMTYVNKSIKIFISKEKRDS